MLKFSLVVCLGFFLSACDGASVSLVPDPTADNESAETDAPLSDDTEADASQDDDADTDSVADSPQTDDSETAQNDDSSQGATAGPQENTDVDAEQPPQVPADDASPEPVAETPASDGANPEPAAGIPASEESDPEPVEELPANDDASPDPAEETPANDETNPEPDAGAPSSDESDPEPVEELPANDDASPEEPVAETPANDETNPEPVAELPASDDNDSRPDSEAPASSEPGSDPQTGSPIIDSQPFEDAAPSEDSSFAQIEALNAIVEHELDYQNVLGGAVAVVQNGAIVHARGYGFTSMQRDDPVSTQTVFRWASISKTLTAIAALQLDETTDNFSIEDNVSRHIDYWTTDSSSAKSNVTVKQLLSHRSGVTHYRNTGNCPDNPTPDFDRTLHGDVPFNARQAVDVFSDQSLCFSPGDRFRYSTFGFSLAAAALERQAGKTYTDWVQEQIAQPLGLQSLTQGTGISTGYKGDCDELTPASEPSKSYVLPGGGWASNIVDLAKFANGIIQGSLLDDTARLWNEPTGNNAYALGIFASVDGQRVSHSGGHGDLRTYMELYLNDDDETGIVVYLNHPYSDPTRLARRVADELGISNWSVPLDAGCQ